MSERFCRDCRHAHVGWADWLLLGGYRYAKCHAVERHGDNERLKAEYLTGARARRSDEDDAYWFCAAQRRQHAACGPEGKLWEPKQ